MTASPHYPFDRFIGIDWSGAQNRQQKGIAVFTAASGGAVPERVTAPGGQNWSRQDVLDYLIHISETQRVLAGIDFAFAYPVSDSQGRLCNYFPGYEDSPETAHDLWSLIDSVNEDRPHLYGGGIWAHPRLGAYYTTHKSPRGHLYELRRRRTELEARSVKSPSPTFKCNGQDNVGTGSLAGMRLLHRLSETAHIWPFDKAETASRPLHLVEIFPSYYFALAGIRAVNGAHGRRENINQTLARFDSEPVPETFTAAGPDHDEADALISAAALRWFAGQQDYWQVPAIARSEGWIFGVKSVTP